MPKYLGVMWHDISDLSSHDPGKKKKVHTEIEREREKSGKLLTTVEFRMILGLFF